ncbi:MAG: tripartite tricarboxylate transporter substrate binding protein [Betaproteobacteria bacterium]
MRQLAFITLVLLAAPCAAARAAEPFGRIQLVNPFPPTGPHDINGSTPANKVLRAMQDHAVPPVTDVLARSLQQTLALGLDVPVSLVRRSRGNGIEARRYVASAAPHGARLLLGSTGTIVIQPMIEPDAKPGPLRRLRPVALVARMPFVLVSRAGSQTKEVQDLLERARAAPGRLHMGSPGDLTIGHLASALLARAGGMVVHHVPFNGSTAAARAVLAEQIDVAMLPLPAVLPYVGNLRMRTLAITDHEPHAALPGVPTVAQAGIGGAVYTAWYGLFIASGAPRHIVERIGEAIAPELRAESVRLMLSRHGLTPAYLPAERLEEAMLEEHARWRPYIEDMKVR